MEASDLHHLHVLEIARTGVFWCGPSPVICCWTEQGFFLLLLYFYFLFPFNLQFYQKQKEETWSEEENAQKDPSLSLSNCHRLCIADNWHAVTVWGSWLHNRTDRHWWWLQRSQSNNLSDVLGLTRPIYRLDLDTDYVAYYEIDTGSDYVVLSSGHKTGDFREVESGPDPRPTDVVIQQAQENGQQCEKFYRLSPLGLIMCKNGNGTVVAASYNWTNNDPQVVLLQTITINYVY